MILEKVLIYAGLLLLTAAAPYWFLCLLCLPFPLLWTRRHLRRRRAERRRRKGECVKCGYDLRESPEKCPECGEEAHH